MSVSFKSFSIMSVGLFSYSTLMFFMGFYSVVYDHSLIVEIEGMILNSCLMSMSFLFDWMGFIFLGSVCLIAGSVMKYSEWYMEGDLNDNRFSFILISFVASMLVLIVSPNLVSLLLGWDGLGLSSYALVIYYQNEVSRNAGMVTILTNRVGDVAILISVALMFTEGMWDFYNLVYSGGENWVWLIAVASFTKSAQIPFSAWLPAAMAAPTPVSALVHSSTLVTAGVYLLIRFNEIICKSGMGSILLVVSVLTMFMAGMCALFEVDLKKVVALSTLSQLGLMVMTLGLGMKELAFFHLITHAMFKSSLFMCVGFMIHSSFGAQDSRLMSSFAGSSPNLGVALGASNLALCGFPFLAGFYSKDMLLEQMQMSWFNLIFMGLAMAGSVLTVAYSFRVLYLSSASVNTSFLVSGLMDFNPSVVKSVSSLFAGSLVSGFVLFWTVLPVDLINILSHGQKYVVFSLMSMGGLLGYSLLNCMKGGSVFQMAVNSSWFLSDLSTKGSVDKSLSLGLFNSKVLDSGWLEFYGGQGGQVTLSMSSFTLQRGQAYMVKGFLCMVVLGGFVLALVL
uniref:NADH-ubiquinone oxidoreductase chain 5 n=1 Tax=Pallaseopsis kessleri TaxID=686709 RepID=A0A1L5BW62_9CRUS|nr:NADH dehydrogenase subunit 5 [Pallaseopsis kessleri]APL97202.1 NADH dehydrogenase subunit 5 [Pallaseopsis kessleri]